MPRDRAQAEVVERPQQQKCPRGGRGNGRRLVSPLNDPRFSCEPFDEPDCGFAERRDDGGRSRREVGSRATPGGGRGRVEKQGDESRGPGVVGPLGMRLSEQTHRQQAVARRRRVGPVVVDKESREHGREGVEPVPLTVSGTGPPNCWSAWKGGCLYSF